MTREVGLSQLRKGVHLLDCLAILGEATPATLAERLDEPRSSVYRLLAGLKELDLVESGSRRGLVRLGFHLVRLGTAVVERFHERRFALPVMERLHEATGETVYLCVRRGFDAVCIERLDGRVVQSLALKIGGALPLHAGAAPRVLLAFEDPSQWAEYLRTAPVQRLTPSTPVTEDELFPVLRQTRQTGLSVSDQDVTIGIGAIGVPVLDYLGHVRAALSISGLRDSILGANGPQLQNLLMVAGREVSASLGWQPADPGVLPDRRKPVTAVLAGP